jgi:hypothetical protein
VVVSEPRVALVWTRGGQDMIGDNSHLTFCYDSGTSKHKCTSSINSSAHSESGSTLAIIICGLPYSGIQVCPGAPPDYPYHYPSKTFKRAIYSVDAVVV